MLAFAPAPGQTDSVAPPSNPSVKGYLAFLFFVQGMTIDQFTPIRQQAYIQNISGIANGTANQVAILRVETVPPTSSSAPVVAASPNSAPSGQTLLGAPTPAASSSGPLSAVAQAPQQLSGRQSLQANNSLDGQTSNPTDAPDALADGGIFIWTAVNISPADLADFGQGLSLSKAGGLASEAQLESDSGYTDPWASVYGEHPPRGIPLH